MTFDDYGLDPERFESDLEGPGSPFEGGSGGEIAEGYPERPWRRLELDVPGTPRPQGSKRHVGRGILVESCRELKPWREAITAAAIEAGATRAEGPIIVRLEFRFDRPKGHYGKRGVKDSAPATKTTKPDIDKL
ncbi:MAG: RusA family crossover junction endodeoxyribonuclease, partial [Candidatus Limnocylindrus sp.]